MMQSAQSPAAVPAPGTLDEPDVRAMFDRISGVYDRMNQVMTAGLHHRWRARAADLARVGPGDRVLDVATGTGDLALELARRVAPDGEVVGSDFSERMLALARAKTEPGTAARFEWGNALELPYPDGGFAAATVGFGARNFADLDRGLAEMARVVRPGGRVVVLEITTPTRPPLSTFQRLWFDRIVPRLGRLAGDPEAYAYLPDSVKRFPGPRGARGPDGRGGARRGGRDRDRGRHHRDPRRDGPGVSAATGVEPVLRVAGPGVEAALERVETRLAELAAGHGALLARHAGATIAAGGKRLRPLLVLLAAGERAAVGDGALRAAVAVELVHSATLVHDDVLDAAALRRGRPTVWSRAGREIATATGDLLFSRAFAELAANGRADEVRVLSDASSALARGELLQRTDAWDVGVPLERYLLRCELKTARLFEAACRLGALEGGAAEAALAAFGRRIGLAFQLLDDVLDVSGPPERTGKPRGTDLLDGTVTLPLILARERDAGLAAADLRAVRTPEAVERVCDAIAATGALEEARRRALAIAQEAEATLPELPAGRRDVFALVARGVVERYA